MTYRYLLMLLGLALVVLGWAERGWCVVLAWLGFNFFVLGIAHWRGFHRVFGKRADGTLPIWSWLLFLPLHIYSIAVWRSLRLLSREPAFNVVSEELVVGRRLLASEVDGEFANYVDLTAEFTEPLAIRRSPTYLNFPVLDGSAPQPEVLRKVLASLRPGRTFVHCAQGHGRTGLFALAVLLSSGAASSVDDGLRILTSARPGIRLNRIQLECIQIYAKGA